MGRTPKSIDAVLGHRTDAEKKLRKEAEEKLKTGVKLREFEDTKKDPVAHKAFAHVKKLLDKNDKNDDMYSVCINRYCVLFSECKQFEKIKDAYASAIEEITRDKSAFVDGYCDGQAAETISLAKYYKLKDDFSRAITAFDSAIMAKRKMMFDIEKENLMTVISGLRSVPKKPPKEETNPLLKALLEDDD